MFIESTITSKIFPSNLESSKTEKIVPPYTMSAQNDLCIGGDFIPQKPW
jgi:hypothetical protein